jgi:putative CocE/NonD family hydrolase
MPNYLTYRPKVTNDRMKPYTSPDRAHFKKVHMESFYVEMRDGVRLAVEVLRPAPLKDGKYPTLLHQTRYWRLPELRAPFHLFSDGLLTHLGKMVREIVKSGYVFVNVDCRGSGASFGTRPFPWSANEVEDGREMVDWILKQPWANGNVGSLGVSYTGTTSEFLLSTQHPAIKAVMPLFSLYDVFDDIAVPGGIPHDGFVKEWGRANQILDANRIPVDDLIAKLLVKGVKPVNGKHGKADLALAILEHQGNQGVHTTSEGVEFRDQPSNNEVVQSMDEFSPHTVTPKSNATQAAVYSGSGWMDGAYPHSSIRRFLNTKNPVNKLMLGPWDHGAKFHITPGKQRKTGPELAGEAIKFFDHYVKGYATGIDKEPRVMYYTMQEERWKSANTWPAPGTKPMRLHLGAEGKLLAAPPSQVVAPLVVTHSPDIGTGEYTRWRGLLGRATTGHLYPDRKAKGKLLHSFTTEILKQSTEVTGHPWVQLWIRSQEKDGSFFVYLEDITPGGEVWYVTEGHRRAIHRKNLTEGMPYLDAVPTPSYHRVDAEPLPSGQPVLLAFDLLPTSYLFKEGHRIRISITTSDKDNFKQVCREGAVYEVLREPGFESWVELPVMGKGL